ncbi:MAG: hypothetical protein JRI85_12715 [Deltaproteobacteria bacterium]|nr:hypothetical protein [Deltaproteobacteria bacterium]
MKHVRVTIVCSIVFVLSFTFLNSSTIGLARAEVNVNANLSDASGLWVVTVQVSPPEAKVRVAVYQGENRVAGVKVKRTDMGTYEGGLYEPLSPGEYIIKVSAANRTKPGGLEEAESSIPLAVNRLQN